MSHMPAPCTSVRHRATAAPRCASYSTTSRPALPCSPRSEKRSASPPTRSFVKICGVSSNSWRRTRFPPWKDSRRVVERRGVEMRAVCWQGKQKMGVENVPDPSILNPHDCIVRVTSTAICGSDLHLYNHWVTGMREGDILGHEFMGEVAEIGPAVKKLKVGDRVVVPFPIACGKCTYCQDGVVSACDN